MDMEKNAVCRAIDYTGRNVIVTGGASGAGVGIAHRFAEAGANVAITYHPGVLYAIARDFGGIDVLMNNAGIYPHQNNLDMSREEWDEMQESNTRGVYFLCQAAAKIMKEQKEGGAIINVSSINATCPSDTLVHYGTSKAAVEFLTRGLAHDWGKYGIRVNCIAPGLIENPMLDTWVPGWRQSYCERAPLGRLVRPEDLGNAALFLGSPLASFITGQILTVDGGVLMAPAFFWDWSPSTEK